MNTDQSNKSIADNWIIIWSDKWQQRKKKENNMNEAEHWDTMMHTTLHYMSLLSDSRAQPDQIKNTIEQNINKRRKLKIEKS